MAVELSYNSRLQILTARVYGHLKFEDIQYFMNQVLTSEEIPSDANTIWDITEMEFDNINIELQQQIVEMRKKFDINRGKAKIAIVSDYALGEPLVKLFLILMKDISQDVSAFKSRDEAMLWFSQS